MYRTVIFLYLSFDLMIECWLEKRKRVACGIKKDYFLSWELFNLDNSVLKMVSFFETLPLSNKDIKVSTVWVKRTAHQKKWSRRIGRRHHHSLKILVLPFSGNCNDHENRCRECHCFQRMKDIRKQLFPPSGNFTQRSNYGRAQQVENDQDGIVHRQSH